MNDQVRKRQYQSLKDATKDSDKHSVRWRTFTSSTPQASAFMGKNYSQILHSIKNTGKDLIMKQMFDTSEKLIVGQSDEVFGMNTIGYDDSPWKHLSLIGVDTRFLLGFENTYLFVERFDKDKDTDKDVDAD